MLDLVGKGNARAIAMAVTLLLQGEAAVQHLTGVQRHAQLLAYLKNQDKLSLSVRP